VRIVHLSKIDGVNECTKLDKRNGRNWGAVSVSAAGNKKNQDLARCLGAASNKKQKIATVTVVVVATAADDDDDAARL
jgi:hypothetical protein